MDQANAHECANQINVCETYLVLKGDFRILLAALPTKDILNEASKLEKPDEENNKATHKAKEAMLKSTR